MGHIVKRHLTAITLALLSCLLLQGAAFALHSHDAFSTVDTVECSLCIATAKAQSSAVCGTTPPTFDCPGPGSHVTSAARVPAPRERRARTAAPRAPPTVG